LRRKEKKREGKEIMSTLYLASILYILENCLKFLKIPVSILSFIDDRLFIAQNKSLSISNSLFFVVIILSLFF